MNHMTYTAWRLARDSVPGDMCTTTCSVNHAEISVTLCRITSPGERHLLRMQTCDPAPEIHAYDAG